jgi:RNA polymerase sigma factor (sigma-70 family)
LECRIWAGWQTGGIVSLLEWAVSETSITAGQKEQDLRLLEGYLRGEEEPFREVEKWMMGEIGARYTIRGLDKEDLCQQVHEKLVASLRSGRFGQRSSFRTYVLSIVHYTCIDALRRKYLRRIDESPEELPAEWGNPYRELEKSEMSQLLHRLLDLSPEICRRLWQMIFLQKLSYQEIGRRLEIPPGTVKSRMFSCRKKALALFRKLRGSPSA